MGIDSINNVDQAMLVRPIFEQQHISSLEDLTKYAGKVVKYTSDWGKTWDYFLVDQFIASPEGVRCFPERRLWNDRLISASVLFGKDFYSCGVPEGAQTVIYNPKAYFRTASYDEFSSRIFSGVPGNGLLPEEAASKACPRKIDFPDLPLCRAPLTLVRSENPADLRISVLFNEKFKPKNPIVPNPSSMDSKYTWNITSQKDGTLKIGDQKARMIWWEATRMQAPVSNPAITRFFEEIHAVCVKREEVKGFLSAALKKMGVQENELGAFVEYWHEVLTKGHDPKNAPYVTIQLTHPDELKQYVPEMEVESKTPFSLKRFYFRFEPRENPPAWFDIARPDRIVIAADKYLRELGQRDLGKNVVLDLGGEIVDTPDVKEKGDWNGYNEFQQRFIQERIYA